jgi:hypothetical protein
MCLDVLRLNHEFEFCRLFNRKVTRVGALEDFVEIDSYAPVAGGAVRRESQYALREESLKSTGK